ncbi:hypothetical protein GCM10009560_05390 [Nonomuraea longicatena]|uniref:Uncharacterized protein n=1 Tax=Nonomuraea longicatena TaxID=83682 RepID=A0ABN1NP59_9ACTN
MTLAASVALKARWYRWLPPSSRATDGMAVTTAIASNAVSITRATRPTLRARYRRDTTLSGGPADSARVADMTGTYGNRPVRHIGRRS